MATKSNINADTLRFNDIAKVMEKQKFEHLVARTQKFVNALVAVEETRQVLTPVFFWLLCRNMTTRWVFK
jgi:hypothetical protein